MQDVEYKQSVWRVGRDQGRFHSEVEFELRLEGWSRRNVQSTDPRTPLSTLLTSTTFAHSCMHMQSQQSPCKQVLYVASPVTGGPYCSQIPFLSDISVVLPFFYFRI